MSFLKSWSGILGGILIAVVASTFLGLEGERLDPIFRVALMVPMAMALFVALWSLVFSLAVAGGVNNRDQAFGLPQGSVRAGFGLLLVLSFIVILGYVVYSETHEGGSAERVTKSNLSLAEVMALDTSMVIYLEKNTAGETVTLTVDELVKEKNLGQGVTYTAVVRKGTSLGQSLADEMITALITLVSSVVAFYFGSRANGTINAVPKPSRVTLVDSLIPKGDQQDLVLILGTEEPPRTVVFQPINGSAPKGKAEVISGTSIRTDSRVVRVSLPPKICAAEGSWLVTVVFDQGSDGPFEVRVV